MTTIIDWHMENDRIHFVARMRDGFQVTSYADTTIIFRPMYGREMRQVNQLSDFYAGVYSALSEPDLNSLRHHLNNALAGEV